MDAPRYPSLYQINTRVWLNELSRKVRRPVTLDDISDAELDHLVGLGFHWVWLLSVWRTGPAAQRVSRNHPTWRREFQGTLTDLREEDVVGSGFAIADYAVPDELGGDAALARLRARMNQRGLRLMLDFVPNHMGLDHAWAKDHPDFFVHVTELEAHRAPHDFTRLETNVGDLWLAHGRDPYFPGWPDTLQLNYANPDTQTAMQGELLKVAERCDGLRCDMAMLVLPDIFDRTWGERPAPFWPQAIGRVRERQPTFTFLAEVYWDLEWELQQQGFDYAYDKQLYDRLHARLARPVREHLRAPLDYQDKLVRFLENHDELRAAAQYPPDVHEAAAVITYLAPGLRFFHQGQLTGRRKHISPHLGRRPFEPVDPQLTQFYERLLAVLREAAFQQGDWQLVECGPAWDGNETCGHFVAFTWQGPTGERWLVAVNYADESSQCRARIPFSDLSESDWRLEDWLSEDVFERRGSELQAEGLYLEMLPWQAAIYALRRKG